jgi:hypothetical protein
MRLRSSPLVATLLIGASLIAGAQANPNRPRAESYTSSTRNGVQPSPACPYIQNVGVAASSSVSATATCTPGAPYSGGAHTAQGISSINGSLFSAAASIDGTLNPATDVQAQGLAYAWNFYTISNPSSIFRIVLATTVSANASASSNPQDYAYALGYIGTYSVNASTGGTVSSLSQQQRQMGDGGYSQYQNMTSGCSRAGVCTNVNTASNVISADLFGSDLNSNGIFAAFLEAYAFERSFDNGAAPITADDDSYAYFTAPTITLYDIDGNDVTSQHTITQDIVTDVVATPEPPALALVATGLLGVFGVSRRRRKAA